MATFAKLVIIHYFDGIYLQCTLLPDLSLISTMMCNENPVITYISWAHHRMFQVCNVPNSSNISWEPPLRHQSVDIQHIGAKTTWLAFCKQHMLSWKDLSSDQNFIKVWVQLDIYNLMAGCCIVDKPLPETMITHLNNIYMHKPAWMSYPLWQQVIARAKVWSWPVAKKTTRLKSITKHPSY